MRIGVAVALILVVGSAPACKKKNAAADGDGGAATAVAPPAPPPPPPPPPPPTRGKDGGVAKTDVAKTTEWAQSVVGPLLKKEAKSRPKGTPTAEQVLDALKKAGIKIRGRNQALASIVGASFCMGADTTTMLGLMICEYATTQKAQQGRKSTELLFGQAITTKVAVNKKTTVSVTYHAKTEATQAQLKQILSVFQKL